MPETRVVNIRHSSFDIFIGRPGKWGNPFIIGRDGTREECIEKFRKHLPSTGLLNSLDELRGRRLGCYCKPLPCHGDVLIEYLKMGSADGKA